MAWSLSLPVQYKIMLYAYIFIVILLVAEVRAAVTTLNWGRNVGDQGTTTISTGDTVSWVWIDSVGHTVDSTGVFYSGVRTSGTYSFTFTTAGSYSYHCNIHNFMKGTIVVQNTIPTIQPTRSPTRNPTMMPTTSQPVLTITPAPTAPSATPTIKPSLSPTQTPTVTPTVAPSVDPRYLRSDILTEPSVISSGSNLPSSWNATLTVRAARVETDVVSFNARLYCYEVAGEETCSYPGPTIVLTAGDNFTLLLVNELGNNPEHTEHSMNTMHQPNTTNIHTHGLHIDPAVDSIFKAALPEGGSLLYRYEVPVAHAPGLHWYHAHTHGSSSMQLMGGLVAALVVQPPAESAQAGLPAVSTDRHTPFNHNIPTSIRQAQSFLVVVTYVVFTQSTVGGAVSQGCGVNFVCNAETQAPLCYGNETTSPYDPFRDYTYLELSADTGSTLDINPVYNDSNLFPPSGSPVRNYHFVNGQYQPRIVVQEGEPFVLRVLHASGGRPLPLAHSADSGCNLSVIAWDGVYLDANLYQEEVRMVAASRADLQLVCSVPGVHSLDTGGEPVLFITVNATDADPEYAYITDSDLAGINRPYYLQDLTGDSIVAAVRVDSNYSVTISQDHTNASVCGFWIGAGTDCSSVVTGGSAQCPYHQFEGQKGTAVAPYLSDNKLVTYPGAVNEWKFYGMGSAFHPLHVHVNHFQIISHDSVFDAGADAYYRRGQWRDTVPPIADVLTFRFHAADYTGETVLHCHFIRHEDLGMMDSYLVADYATYAAVNSHAPSVMPTARPSAAPTAAPTAAPSRTPTTAPTAAPMAPSTARPTRAPTTFSNGAGEGSGDDNDGSSASSSSSSSNVVVGASIGGVLGLCVVGALVYYFGGMEVLSSVVESSSPVRPGRKVLPV